MVHVPNVLCTRCVQPRCGCSGVGRHSKLEDAHAKRSKPQCTHMFALLLQGIGGIKETQEVRLTL